MDTLFDLAKEHGLSVVLIACMVIFLIGTLKFFGAFNKVAKSNRKPIFLVLTYILSFAIASAYYAIFNIDFSSIVAYGLTVATVTSLLYVPYENLKLRDLLALFGNFIIKIVAQKQIDNATAKIVEQKEQTPIQSVEVA